MPVPGLRLVYVPFILVDYLELVDFTGRTLLEDKQGVIGYHKPPILQQLQTWAENWMVNAIPFETNYHTRALPMGCRRRISGLSQPHLPCISLPGLIWRVGHCLNSVVITRFFLWTDFQFRPLWRAQNLALGY